MEMLDNYLQQLQENAQHGKQAIIVSVNMFNNCIEAKGETYAGCKRKMLGLMNHFKAGCGKTPKPKECRDVIQQTHDHFKKTLHEGISIKKEKILKEAGFEKYPKGWSRKTVKKFAKSLGGGGKKTGFFKKCVKKMTGNVDNPEGFCAAVKDETHGSTGWRGKDKTPAEVKVDVKKAKFKT